MHAPVSVYLAPEANKCDGTVMVAVGVASHAMVKARILDAGGPEAYEEFYRQCMLAHLCSHCHSAHTHMTCTIVFAIRQMRKDHQQLPEGIELSTLLQQPMH